MNHLYFVIRGTVEVLSGDVIMAILGQCCAFYDKEFAYQFVMFIDITL